MIQAFNDYWFPVVATESSVEIKSRDEMIEDSMVLSSSIRYTNRKVFKIPVGTNMDRIKKIDKLF